MKRYVAVASILVACATGALAQSTQSTPVPPAPSRTRTVDPPQPAATPKVVPKAAKPAASPSPQTPQAASTTATGPSAAVLAAFDKIIEGVRRANVNMVTNGYWNSAALVLFNYNGTVTKGWSQMRSNREASYPDIKDVTLDVRDKHVVMLGRDGAVVTCLWTQSQTYKGQPDTASGRMTLVFKRVGTEWKAVHLHTSPDKPDPSRIPASEQPNP